MLLLTAMLIQSAPIEGQWSNPSNSVTVTIAPCGNAWCGTVTRASDEAKADATKGGTATLVGTQLMSGFAPDGKGRWRGRLFVPDLNKRTRAELSVAGPGQLKVRGCLVGKALCKSQLWTRDN